jgi:hypothetical protein
LNGSFPFFLQHSDGQVEIRDLRIIDDCLAEGDKQYVRPETFGFSVVRILQAGQPVALKNPPPGRTSNSGETFFPAGNTPVAALAGIGLTQDGKVVRIGLLGDLDDQNNPDRLPTEDDLSRYLLDFGVTDALFGGGSGDVQHYDARSNTITVASERAKSADKKRVLRPGQTERGLSLIIKLVEQSSRKRD